MLIFWLDKDDANILLYRSMCRFSCRNVSRPKCHRAPGPDFCGVGFSANLRCGERLGGEGAGPQVKTGPAPSLFSSIASHSLKNKNYSQKDSTVARCASVNMSKQEQDLPIRPPFSSLPLDPSGPAGNAWGLYGEDDCLGALNLLTSDVVAAAAASEIRVGDRVSLDWRLDLPSHSSFGRAPFEWKLQNRTKPGAPHRTVNDDTVHFNTQCSSQWDGFRHYGALPFPLYH